MIEGATEIEYLRGGAELLKDGRWRTRRDLMDDLVEYEYFDSIAEAREWIDSNYIEIDGIRSS